MKMLDRERKKKLVADGLLVLCLLLAALLCFFVFRGSGANGARVRVYIDGAAVAEYPLDADGEYELNGGTNRLTVSGGKAAITYAECPDGVCVRTGWLRLVGERSVCLPNRVMIEIVGSGELDFVS